ncbi:polysaccharide biosynthesis C-terminal domain-containing protein, partial [Sphingomonas sp.]|uniref:polysaccharide biosynthesis C-terminal domain-containing protein n=1 Tax=Sphingomonas sp. TaxID=28214 RepID=UPI0031CEC318
FAPAPDARGRPGIAAQISATGAVVLPAAFLIGVHWGVKGLALTWIAIWPVFLAITAARSLPVIELKWRDWLAAIAPPVTAAAAMGLAVVLIDRALPPLSPLPHLLVLTAAGAAIYGAWLWLFARETVEDAIRMIRR